MTKEMKPTRWWRVVDCFNVIWCETSSEDEARESMRPEDKLQRLYSVEISEWRDEI